MKAHYHAQLFTTSVLPQRKLFILTSSPWFQFKVKLSWKVHSSNEASFFTNQERGGGNMSIRVPRHPDMYGMPIYHKEMYKT